MIDKIICPECEKDKIVFCGVGKMPSGEMVNVWQCLDCEHEWTTAITPEQKLNWNGK